MINFADSNKTIWPLMRRLTEAVREYLPAFLPQAWDGNIFCSKTNVELIFRTNVMNDLLAIYSFTLVRQGWLKILYNNEPMMLEQNDLYFYNSGFAVRVLDASPDYRGYCIMADADYVLGATSVHQALDTVYFPLVELRQPKMSLTSGEADHLCQFMALIDEYQHQGHPRMNESVALLFGLFLHDLSALQEKAVSAHRHSKRHADIYKRFVRLLSIHYMEHHNVGFYAGRLNITTTYLSRIIRQITGRTVIDHIDQMLIIEAMWLLNSTTLSIAQIAERLHFAESTTFSRFFRRLKGLNPNAYRNRILPQPR